MKKEVVVLVGTGSIGLAIARRVSAGNHLVLADYSIDYAETAARLWKMLVLNVLSSSVT